MIYDLTTGREVTLEEAGRQLELNAGFRSTLVEQDKVVELAASELFAADMLIERQAADIEDLQRELAASRRLNLAHELSRSA